MATVPAITFDFHNTLASCDRWFALEVRDLPGAVLDRVRPGLPAELDVPSGDEVTATYRALRGEVIEHGVEIDAVAGTLETLRRLGIEVREGQVQPAIDDLMRGALVDLRPMEGALETVRALHADGFPLGVVSSAVHHPFLEWSLASFGILDLFTTVVTSASAGFYKSRPEIYQRALDDLGVDAASSVHVGDSHRWDHVTPSALGIRTVLVSSAGAVDPSGPLPSLALSTLVDAAKPIADLARGGSARSA